MVNNKAGRLIALSAAVLVAAAGCSVTPKAVTQDERAKQAREDLGALFANQEPVSGPISLYEAMARAIKYNLDHRVKLMEKAVTEAELKVARMDMLPSIALQAGYNDRSNDAGGSSQSLLTGLESLEPSTSVEKQRTTTDAILAWNVLDFGVSYATAQQGADRILIAEERRRKTIQNIMQDVRVAYWQAASAQTLTPVVEGLLADTRKALDRSRDLEKRRVQSPLAALEYQKGLLETLRDLWQLRQRLDQSKTELASLMNLRPGTKFELVAAGDAPVIPAVDMDVESLEDVALINRPELVEEDLQLRISRTEVTKAVRRMLPGISIEWGAHHDDNKFLYNSSWSDLGLRVTWNLFNIVTGPAAKAQAERNVEVADMRRLAKSLAVMTQVRVAWQRYAVALEDYNLTRDIYGVDSRIAGHLQAGKQSTTDELSLIRRRANAMVAQMQRDMAYAELQNSVGRIHNSLGIDPLPKTVPGHDVASLSSAIKFYQGKLDKGIKAAVTAPSLKPAMSAPMPAPAPMKKEARPAPAKSAPDQTNFNTGSKAAEPAPAPAPKPAPMKKESKPAPAPAPKPKAAPKPKPAPAPAPKAAPDETNFNQ